MTISLDSARSIVGGALRHGGDEGFNPLAVVVLDAGGHVVAAERQDGAAIGRIDIAHGKANGAISLGVSSRTLGEMAIDRPHFMAGATGAIRGSIVPVAGGLLVESQGVVIGAVGVSGDTSDHDESAASAGINAAGLVVRAI